MPLWVLQTTCHNRLRKTSPRLLAAVAAAAAENTIKPKPFSLPMGAAEEEGVELPATRGNRVTLKVEEAKSRPPAGCP
jgi:hypothetical protein